MVKLLLKPLEYSNSEVGLDSHLDIRDSRLPDPITDIIYIPKKLPIPSFEPNPAS